MCIYEAEAARPAHRHTLAAGNTAGSPTSPLPSPCHSHTWDIADTPSVHHTEQSLLPNQGLPQNLVAASIGTVKPVLVTASVKQQNCMKQPNMDFTFSYIFDLC